MKAVILAGGLGTRLSEETTVKPKPMVEIGGKPILWHIMKSYSAHGINDFVICCGYRGYAIKEFFANYFPHTSDVTFDLQANSMESARAPRRTMARHAHRHRRRQHDRRPPQARARTSEERGSLLLHLW
jgi:glucose-1-phosphate cytidylyltransferase